MKRILLVIILLLLAGCGTQEKNLLKVKERVLKEFQKDYPDDEFYFVYGPDYNSEKSQTNIRYRGILSTKRLEELGYNKGFQINLENVDSSFDTRKYQNTLDYLDVYNPLKKEAKEIIGENIIFEINGTYTSSLRKLFLENLGTNLPVENKTGFSMIILTGFVDDLYKELDNIEFWKEKIYQLGKKYWKFYNMTGSLQIYLYDKKLLSNPVLTVKSLSVTSRNNKQIQDIVLKLKNTETLTTEEENLLIKNFISGDLFMDSALLTHDIVGVDFFTLSFESEDELVKSNIAITNRLRFKTKE